MNHNLLVPGIAGSTKLSKPMLIQLGITIILFFATIIIGLNAYGKYTANNNLKNAIEKFNERNYKHSQFFFNKYAPESNAIRPSDVNFHSILAFLNGDIENARKLNDMLSSEADFEDYYTISKKLIWSINPDSNNIAKTTVVSNTTDGNTIVSNGFSYMQKGDFEKAYEEFNKIIGDAKNTEISTPTRDGCVAAYSGAALALVGKNAGTLDGTETLDKLSLTDMELALSYFRSAQVYLTPYSPAYYNYERLYAAYIFRHLKNDSSYDTLYSLMVTARKELNLNLDNPDSSNEHFKKLSAATKWLETSENDKRITQSSSLPVNALWKHRVKILYHAFACLLAEMSTKTADELKLRYATLSDRFWTVIFNFYPEIDYFRAQSFVCKVKIFKGAVDVQFRKICAQSVYKILEHDIEKPYLANFNKNKLEKLKSITFEYGYKGKK